MHTCKYRGRSETANFVPQFLAPYFSSDLLLSIVSLLLLLILEIQIITSVN